MYPPFFLPIILFLILEIPDQVLASNTPNIELNRPVHFLTPGGDMVEVKEGIYDLNASEGWLQLTPQGKEGGDAAIGQERRGTSNRGRLCVQRLFSSGGRKWL